jgi:hypothetical protein
VDPNEPGRDPSRVDAPGGRSDGALTLVVSNNRFTVQDDGARSRARLDAGKLSVALVKRSSAGGARAVRHTTRHVRTCRQLELAADGRVLAVIDGHERILTPPIRLRTIPFAVCTGTRAYASRRP